MNEIQKKLLSLLAANIAKSDSKTDDISPEDADSIMNEAFSQAVPLFALDALPKDKISRENREKTAAFAAKNLNLRQVQKGFVKLLDENGVPYVILKGEAAAADYPDPSLRLLGDIDVLVDPENLEKVGKLLESKGFEADAEENGSHRVYRSHSIRIEVHWKIPGMPENEALAAYLRNVIKDAVSVNGEFMAPKDEHQVLILLLHAKHHILYEGIGLRHFCDIACLFNKTANADFYEKSLIPLLENAGLATFAKIVAKTCSIYLGSPLPDFAKDADDDLCREFIEDIFAGGNFGEKDDGRIRSGSIMKDGKGKSAAGSMFATLGENVRARAKGRKILYPFLYIGLSVKYLFLVIFGKRPTPKETASDINKRTELYKKMQIM